MAGLGVPGGARILRPSAEAREPAAAIGEFWVIVDILGRAFAARAPSGATVTDCQSGANQISVFFDSAGIVPDVAELTWTLPGGAVAGPFPAFMDTATERGTGSIRRIDDGDLANGPCGVAFSYGDEVLAEGTITLACPP